MYNNCLGPKIFSYVWSSNFTARACMYICTLTSSEKCHQHNTTWPDICWLSIIVQSSIHLKEKKKGTLRYARGSPTLGYMRVGYARESPTLGYARGSPTLGYMRVRGSPTLGYKGVGAIQTLWLHEGGLCKGKSHSVLPQGLCKGECRSVCSASSPSLDGETQWKVQSPISSGNL